MRSMVEGDSADAMPQRDQHPLHVLQHRPRRDAQSCYTLPLQPRVSSLIAGDPLRVVMARPINLDGQPYGVAVEVQDTGSFRMLTTKAHPDLVTPDPLPEQDFGQGHLASERASTLSSETGRIHESNLWR